MGDDKQPLLDTLSEKGVRVAPLPAPAVATAPPTRATARRWLRKSVKHLIVFAIVYVCVWRWSQLLKPRVEEEAARWLANPFAAPGHWRYGQYGKDHGAPGRPLLNGKLAEELFLTIPNGQSAITASRRYASKPHMAGTLGDYQTALDFLTLLQTQLGITPPKDEPIFSAGTDDSRRATLSIPTLDKPTAWIDVYYPVMNTPLNHSVEILSDDGLPVWSAQLEEVPNVADPDAAKYFDAVPAFHGLSRSGEVKGKIVYANYGRQEDYKALIDKGVSLNGTIVLVRYGGIFRGLKVKGAEELGAAGVLIYSDPADDGSVTESNGYLPYPAGPARNPTSVQRGSVQYLSTYPGDPTTPGYPSYENSTRTEGENIPSIPSLPLSSANAQILLNEIKEGGLNRTVSLVNHVDTRVIPIWNTMGVIPGHIKDEVLIIGNHRDAWVLGATDPTSGTASVHEIIKGFGALSKAGWQPLRTIVIASWDAEEYGLIGSTEWVEDFKKFIEKHVVAYLNLDSSASGSRFRANASPTLAHLVRRAADRVPHPTKLGKTLWDAIDDDGTLEGDVDDEVLAMYEEQFKQSDDLGVTPLGSGSDYTAFLQHVGIASTSEGFGSTLHDPVYHYHSIYDSQRWQEVYNDPGFVRHVAVAKHLGLIALRLADAIVLPLNTTHYTLSLQGYLDDVESIASDVSLDVNFSPLRHALQDLAKSSEKLDEEKAEAEEELKQVIKEIVRKRIIRRKLRKAWCKVRKALGKPCKKHSVGEGNAPSFRTHNGQVVTPRIGRFPVWLEEQKAQQSETKHACHFKDKDDKKNHKKLRKAIKRIEKVNKKLVAFERGLISKEGIKDREWYKHLGVAPGKWLGYGATTLPALTESFTIERNATLADHEVHRLKKLIHKLAKEIKP